MSDFTLKDFCPTCGSYNLIELIESDSCHHARLECSDCERFIRWIPKPSKHIGLVDVALNSGRVSGWENMFLRSIRNRRRLTPKQQEKFSEIVARHQIKNPTSVDTG